MKYSLVSTLDDDTGDPASLDTWTTNEGPVALAYTTQDRLQSGVATSQGWRGQGVRVGVADFDASGAQELLLLIEQSGFFGRNLVFSLEELQQVIRETGTTGGPYVLIAVEGEPLFERTYDEWIR